MKMAYKKKVTDLQLQNVILLSQKKITEKDLNKGTSDIYKE